MASLDALRDLPQAKFAAFLDTLEPGQVIDERSGFTEADGRALLEALNLATAMSTPLMGGPVPF